MITIESTTCYTISGPESFEQGRFLNFVSTVKIQEERATASAERESAKITNQWKDQMFLNLGFVLSRTTY